MAWTGNSRWRKAPAGVGAILCAMLLLLAAPGQHRRDPKPGPARPPAVDRADEKEKASPSMPAGWRNPGDQGPLDPALRPEDVGARIVPVRQFEPIVPPALHGPIAVGGPLAMVLGGPARVRGRHTAASLQILLCVWRT